MAFNQEGFITITDLIDGLAGVGTTVEFAYTLNAGSKDEVGDPTNPSIGVTWTTFTPTDSIPGTAFWTARREKSGLVQVFSDWILLPAAASTSILPFVTTEITGADAPVLGSSNWNTQALQAASSFTGRTFTQLKALGYGTVIIINYPDNTGGAVKIRGKYVKGDPQWTTFTESIDGDLFVDGTIAADKIQSNSLTSTQIKAGSINADRLGFTAGGAAQWSAGTYNVADQVYNNGNFYVADVSTTTQPPGSDWTALVGSGSNTGERAVVDGSGMRIYDDAGNLRVNFGDLSIT